MHAEQNTKHEQKNEIKEVQKDSVQNVNNKADKYLDENIVEARTDHDKACDLYRKYVHEAEDFEERRRRINRFRSGGW